MWPHFCAATWPVASPAELPMWMVAPIQPQWVPQNHNQNHATIKNATFPVAFLFMYLRFAGLYLFFLIRSKCFHADVSMFPGVCQISMEQFFTGKLAHLLQIAGAFGVINRSGFFNRIHSH